MAIKNSTQHIASSLDFRILAPIIPIIVLMVLLGGAVFSLGLGTVTHYANARIAEDLERTSREIYNICDAALQKLLIEGVADSDSATTVRKGNTIGKIEEYARQENLQIIVYSGNRENVLLQQTETPIKEIFSQIEVDSSKPVLEIYDDNNHYYARFFDFELWDWHIILLKDGEIYSEFGSKIRQSYYAIGGILLVVSLLLIFYFRRVVHKPVRSIIASIQKNGMPNYKGIYEFEFLSNVIREATLNEHKKQLEMSYQASHDALTGLVNRREFERCLESMLLKSRAQLVSHTILYLDLDQFKIINDTCGHNAGDVLLQQLTKLLKSQLRQCDVLARLGGDEFGVLLQNCPGDPAYRIAESLRRVVDNFRFVWEEKIYSVGVSIGLVTFGDDGFTLNDILSIVDGACYIAKDKGRNRIHVYHFNDSELMERKGQMNWVARITNALEDDRFVLYQQKIIPLQYSPEKTMHFEILLRMLDEDGNIVLPSSFIPAAERYNLMASIDFWVIKHAFEYCNNLCTNTSVIYTCAINLSGTTIGDERLINYIKDQLNIYNISPQTITFEITETAAIANLDTAVTLMYELKQLGCQFSLDDFGSGMSSFGYLKSLPVDFIKIDGSFVKNMCDDRMDSVMVKAIAYIGQELGIQTIAEFVENDEIKEALRKLDVNFAQGYGIRRPEPLRRVDITRLQKSREGNSVDQSDLSRFPGDLSG